MAPEAKNAGPRIHGMPADIVLLDEAPAARSDEEYPEATEEQMQWQEAKVAARQAKLDLDAALLALDQQTGLEARAAAD